MFQVVLHLKFYCSHYSNCRTIFIKQKLILYPAPYFSFNDFALKQFPRTRCGIACYLMQQPQNFDPSNVTKNQRHMPTIYEMSRSFQIQTLPASCVTFRERHRH